MTVEARRAQVVAQVDLAERDARARFIREGEHPPVLYAFTDTEWLGPALVDVNEPDPRVGANKRRALLALLCYYGARALVLVMETWIARAGTKAEADIARAWAAGGGSYGDLPGHLEAIVICGAAPGVEIMRTVRIVRDADGKASLEATVESPRIGSGILSDLPWRQ